MSLSLHKLLPLFERERARGCAVVLATVARTAGSTYTKAGAHMLIAGDGEYAGLLSGGCLEGDLAEHARAVLSSGTATVVRYDMGGADELLFGLGSGCEGAMDVLLQRLDASNDWQPLRRLAPALARPRMAHRSPSRRSPEPAPRSEPAWRSPGREPPGTSSDRASRESDPSSRAR